MNEKILLWIVRVCSSAILFLPLVVSTHVTYPFTFSKVILFQSLVEISVVCWIILLAYIPSYRPQWRHPIVRSLSIFIGVLILTTITGFDPWLSWWSAPERGTGVFFFIHAWLWFLIIASTFKTWREWKTLSYVSIAISVGVVLYGISGQVPEVWKGVFTSSLGNPIYVGVYVILHFFLALFFFFHEKNLFIRLFLGASMAANLGAMLVAGSRSVFLSFLFAAVLFFLAVGLFRSTPRRVRIVLCGGVAILLFLLLVGTVVLVTPTGRQWGQETLPQTIVRTLYRFDSESNQDRLVLMNIGLQGFLERPVLGWGWDSYFYIYEKYLVPRPYMDAWYDRSHNQLVDILAFTGIVGFMAYLWFWWSLIRTCFLEARREKFFQEKISWYVLCSLFFFYFLQNLTAFDSPGPLFIFFFSLGLLTFFSRNATQEERQEVELARRRIPSFVPIVVPLVPLVFISFIPLYFFNVLPYIKNNQFVKALLYEKNGALRIQNLKDSFDTPVYINFDNLMLITAHIIKEPSLYDPRHSENRALLAFIMSELERQIERHPYYVKAHVLLGGLYSRVSAYDPSALTKGEVVLQKALAFSKNRQEIYSFLGRIAVSQQNQQEAVSYAEKALSLGAQKNRASLYFERAQSYLVARKFDASFEDLERAEKMGHPIYNGTNFSLPLAKAMPFGMKEKRALDYIEKAVQKNKNDVHQKTYRAILYEKAGEKKQALQYFQELEAMNPEAARQARELLQSEKSKK